jgi:4-diphosphocytidyl-2C-methyl-D-erythritol kinase
MQMKKILDCSVLECVYNKNQQCHTMAITVGSDCPMCESYMSAASKGGAETITGGVGACHQGDCTFNKSFECNANGIHVGKHSDHADCETYKPK